MLTSIRSRIRESISNLQALNSDESTLGKIAEVAQVVINAIRSGNKLMICGNGGSAADAQHIAAEFVCRFYKDRKPLPAIALCVDTSILTSISNDYSYTDVFSRQVKALGRKGDVLLGISTSGGSENVFEAFKTARELGIKTILLTGETQRDIAVRSDIIVPTPSCDTPRVQEMLLLIEHILCEIVETEIFGDP